MMPGSAPPRRARCFALAGVLSLAAACASPSPSPSASAVATPASPAPTATVAATVILPSPSATAGTSGDVPAPLDGLFTTAVLAARLPIAVMIDDNIVARPQAGFDAASIVYQAPADGGEDRYMMVFQEGDAALVGPVRSGRPYFVRWAAEYRAIFAHYGGDAKTLAYLPTINHTLIFDLDALAGSAAAFHRVSGRQAPHNAYTSTASMSHVGSQRGAPVAMVSGLVGRPFREDLPAAQRATAATITVPYQTGTVSYTYDPVSDAYLRSVAGRPQLDAATGARVTARSVVVAFMALSIDPQSEPGHHRPVLAQIGTGKAVMFEEGHVVQGTWRKDSVAGLTHFYDAAGDEVALVRGRLFVQVVPTGTKVVDTTTP